MDYGDSTRANYGSKLKFMDYGESETIVGYIIPPTECRN
jgi:hypothetical protein